MEGLEGIEVSTVILLRGRPGVGKTAVSDKLAIKLGVPIVRKDDLYDELAGAVEGHELRNQLAYGMLYRILESNALSESRIILDFPFNREDDMVRFAGWLTARGIVLKPVLCICSDERLWAERFNVRCLNPAPNQLITDFETLKKHYGDLAIRPLEGELVVDTVQTLESIVGRIMAFVEN